MFDEVAGLQGLAEYLGVHVNDARHLSAVAGLKPSSTRVSDALQLNTIPVFRKSDVDEAIQNYSKTIGLIRLKAALELGLTPQSFDAIRSFIRYGKDDRFLKEFLESFRNQFLPRFKIWSSRSVLMREFVNNYNQQAAVKGEQLLTLQNCDVEHCNNIASDQCINSRCRDQQEPRFICPKHSIWVDTNQPISIRPESICPVCAERTKAGELNYRFMGKNNA